MEGNGRGGRKGKGEARGEVQGGIWPTQKFWCGAPYACFGDGWTYMDIKSSQLNKPVTW